MSFKPSARKYMFTFLGTGASLMESSLEITSMSFDDRTPQVGMIGAKQYPGSKSQTLVEDLQSQEVNLVKNV